MITKEKLTEILKVGVSTGADFAEIFIESTVDNTMRGMSGEIETATTSETYGAGIRLLQGVDEVYGYTNDVSFDSLKQLATDLSQSFEGKPGLVLPLGEERPYKVKIERRMGDVPHEERAEILKRVSKRISDYSRKLFKELWTYLKVSNQ